MTSHQGRFYSRIPLWVYVLIFSLGHFALDFYATMVTPLLGEFQDVFHIEKWQILAYTATATIFGSLLQPVLGILADHYNRGVLAAISVLMAAVFMSLSGLAPHPLLLSLFLALGGLGVGLFHPATAAAVAQLTPGRSNFLMSIFVVSGMAGLGSSGLIVPEVVQAGTQVFLERTWLFAPAGVIVGLCMLFFVPFAPGVSQPGGEKSLALVWQVIRDFFSPEFGPVRKLWVIAALRALVMISFNSFVPFIAKERGWSLVAGGRTLAVILFSLGIGGLVGGYLSDRVRALPIYLVSTFGPLPCLIVFALWNSLGALFFFGAAGFLIGMATPLTVVLAQQLQPEKAGLVSGLMMGFAWGVSGLCLPFLGWLAQPEMFGNVATLVGVALLLIPACLLLFWMPKETMGRT